MFEVSVASSFPAAHQLRRPDGTREPVHTHDWQVRVTYAGPVLDEAGVLLDFTALRARLEEVLTLLREQRLNDLPAFARCNPSAENVARYIAGQLIAEVPGAAWLTCVEVEEEAGCVARYRPPRHVADRPPCG